MGMERIEFRSDRDNLRSIEAMKSIGCKEEGVLRSNIIKSDKTRRNSIILSILREEPSPFVSPRMGCEHSLCPDTYLRQAIPQNVE